MNWPPYIQPAPAQIMSWAVKEIVLLSQGMSLFIDYPEMVAKGGGLDDKQNTTPWVIKLVREFKQMKQ